MPQFTPGPWTPLWETAKSECADIVRADETNDRVAITVAQHKAGIELANARLIAASPELYAAVQAVSECESCLDENGKQFLKVPASSIFDLGAELKALLAKVDGDA